MMKCTPFKPAVAFQEHSAEELLGPLNDVEKRYAPQRLHSAGREAILKDQPRVAIVGTRHPTSLGRRRAAKLARLIVKSGATVVSGLAEGIDTIAHETAIEEEGTTIAVLGTPLDCFYPRKNEPLQKLIMLDHLALSQFPPGHPVLPKNFPIRNRTMALISHASVIIEAGDGSGTLSQGWEALRLGRPLFILASLINKTSISWPEEMMRYGARVLSDIDSLLEYLPWGDAALDAEIAF